MDHSYACWANRGGTCPEWCDCKCHSIAHEPFLRDKTLHIERERASEARYYANSMRQNEYNCNPHFHVNIPMERLVGIPREFHWLHCKVE